MNKYINFAITFIYSSIIGSLVGLITWSFLTLVFLGIQFFWHDLPKIFNTQYFTLILCTIGGFLVGLTQKYFGSYPKTMPVVLKEFKETGEVEYKSLPKGIISALVVLWAGASLGPEAALTGIIGGFATLSGEFLKYGIKRQKLSDEYKNIIIDSSMNATVSIIFKTPLYGFSNLINSNDNERLKKIKTIIYSITVGSGFLTLTFLSKIDNRASFVSKFGSSFIGIREVIFLIPLIILGILLSLYYKSLGKFLKKLLSHLDSYKIIKAILGGFVLGLLSTYIPYILFSGEHSLRDLILNWSSLSAFSLFIICIIKLFATEFCISSGLLGGHIFPVMFSGAAFGFALSSIFGIDPVLACAIIMSTSLSIIMENAVISIFLLVLFFPINLAPFIVFSSVISLSIYGLLPKALQTSAH